MNNKPTQLSVVRFIVAALIAVCFIRVAAMQPTDYAAPYALQTHAEPAIIADSTNILPDTTEAYSAIEATTTTERVIVFEELLALPPESRDAVSRTLMDEILSDEPNKYDEARYILSDEEVRLLCFMAETEDNTSVEGRQACMQVVLNRLYSDKFAQDSVYDVLYAPKQFQTMRRYYDEYEPTVEALEAVRRLLHEDDIFNGEIVLFFSASWVKPSKIARGLYFVAEISDNVFYGQE